jgi:hypothetical protein
MCGNLDRMAGASTSDPVDRPPSPGLRVPGMKPRGCSLSVGPIRNRRVVWSIGFAVMWAGPFTIDRIGEPSAVVILTTGFISAVRAARMRIERSDGQLVVVSFFRTIRVPLNSVRSAGFAPAKWDGFAVPLVLAGQGFVVRASGVSVWSRQWRWPDQPFVRGRRSLARIERFLGGSTVAFDPREPVPTKPLPP